MIMGKPKTHCPQWELKIMHTCVCIPSYFGETRKYNFMPLFHADTNVTILSGTMGYGCPTSVDGKFHSGEGINIILCVRSYRQNLYTIVGGNPKSPRFRIDPNNWNWAWFKFIWALIGRTHVHSQTRCLLPVAAVGKRSIPS